MYIQDRTVIEDTGATVDLIRRGWRLHNHPERLAYSATPPDFGSLIIQRRRWANGGLIIFPDLLRYRRERAGSPPSLMELLMRAHYLCSPALVSLAVLLLLALPLDGPLASVWLPATALPYYALYARDLLACGYRWRELPYVYALNLMLLPVNLAGVLRSLQQIITGRKSSFGRTPKIDTRTPTPAVHVLLQFALIAGTVTLAVHYLLAEHYYLALFCAANAGALLAGLVVLIGVPAACADLVRPVCHGWRAVWARSPQSLRRPADTTMQTMRVPTRPTGALAQPAVVTERDGRILGMEGLRAYAVILVFLVHFLSQYFNGATSSLRIDFDDSTIWQLKSIPEAIAFYFWASHYGVDLFFFLSGFLIYRLVSNAGFDYRTFLRDRTARLYPAFLAALAIYMAYMTISWHTSFDWFSVAGNLLMLQGVWQSGIKPIIVPTWSLSFEWAFYLAFPAVLLLPSARRTNFAVASCARCDRDHRGPSPAGISLRPLFDVCLRGSPCMYAANGRAPTHAARAGWDRARCLCACKPIVRRTADLHAFHSVLCLHVFHAGRKGRVWRWFSSWPVQQRDATAPWECFL